MGPWSFVQAEHVRCEGRRTNDKGPRAKPGRSPMKKIFLILLAVLTLPHVGSAVKIADITRIGGQRSNILTGLGLIYGLKGSGDGGDFLPAIKPLAGMLSKFANPTAIKDLSNVQNVALV